jgi:hypothetical protein
VKYRKKPVVIEAIQYTGRNVAEAIQFTGRNAADIGSWASVADWEDFLGPPLTIHTLEGNMTANVGDWIIRGVAGEIYPCRSDIFQATYEAVPDDAELS